tara:strand:+ start:6691 stop:7215 length:525 start_codon:yes stop_codon:yes gene_type:complete
MVDGEIHIETDRFILRTLTSEDASPKYARWLDEQSSLGFIATAKEKNHIEHIRKYILERNVKDDVLFLGIFTRSDFNHIGNIKYEPINYTARYAVVGVMIGESDWQGKAVLSEVIAASTEWLKEHCHINKIVLGVNLNNQYAIKAYEKSGFKVEKTNTLLITSSQSVSMVLHLE